MDESGKVAVVTGAGSGIGAACCEELLGAGWNVHGWDQNPGEQPDVTWSRLDVSDFLAVGKSAERLDGVDLLVNAAGISGPRCPTAEMHPSEWARTIAVNLSGTLYCCHALHRQLSARQGVVVNLASAAGIRPAVGRVPYNVAKAGVVMLTSALGLEWAAEGVRVVAVAPGFIRTPMLEAGIQSGKLTESGILERTPLGRMGDAAEIARAIIALAGEPFTYVTGTTVVVDGGATLVS